MLPWLHEDYGRIARLSAPVGYWNGLALLGDIALPMGLCLATRMRTAGTLLVFGWLVVIGLTYSRGGVLVAIVVVALWMLLSKAWLESLSTLLAAGLPAAAALGVALALSGITSDGQSHPTRVRDGLVFGVVLLADAAIAAGLARFVLPATAVVRKLALGLLVVLVAASLAFGAVHARTWWNNFTAPAATELPNSPARLVQLGSNFRWGWWTQAWKGWTTEPIAGTGAGSFEVTNKRYRQSSLDETIEPHSLPVQFLSETGIDRRRALPRLDRLAHRPRAAPPRAAARPRARAAGLLPARAARYRLGLRLGLGDRLHDRRRAGRAPVDETAAAGLHRPDRERRPRGRRRVPASRCGSAATGKARPRPSLQVDNAKAVTLANRARRVNGLTVDPLFTAALAETAIADLAAKQRRAGWIVRYDDASSAAQGYLIKATRVQPDNALAWYLLGSFQLSRGCPYAALPSFSKATVFDGQDPTYSSAYARTLARVNSGKEKC